MKYPGKYFTHGRFSVNQKIERFEENLAAVVLTPQISLYLENVVIYFLH
jgi:hypothetical protein